MQFLVFLLIFLKIHKSKATIDINIDELQYLSDHLTPLECRELVAACHYKSFEKPNNLEEAEQKLPTDQTCLQLLSHWNSGEGEGRGETHELLQRRLRQIGKLQLADWLGKTVFKQLGKDMEEKINDGFKDIITETSTERMEIGPTLQPMIENQDPTEWWPIDSILLAIVGGLLIMFIGLSVKLLFSCIFRKIRNKRMIKSRANYEAVTGETSGSDSEDYFDVRHHLNKEKK